MSILSKTSAKALFQTGDRPTQTDFEDLIDTTKPDYEISVKHYGAVGDDVTDDTAAIQAALSAAVSGTRVYLPFGTYRVSSQLRYGIHAQIVGDGPEASIINATHSGVVLGPISSAALHRGMNIADIGITKASAAVSGTGIGLLVTKSRSSVFENLEISNCGIGVKFAPVSGANNSYSYFNLFRNLVLFANSSAAVQVAVSGDDRPNANTFSDGDWRNGNVVCDLREGSDTTLLNGSIQSATTDWLHARVSATGVRVINMRFENADNSELATGGIRVSGANSQVIGGNSSKGQLIFGRTLDGDEPFVIGHRHNGTYITVGGTQYPASRADGMAEWGAWGGVGLYQNYLTRSDSLNTDPPWTPTGTFPATGSQSDRFGGTTAVKVSAASSNPYLQQTTTTTAASKTVCFSIWMRGDTDGYVKLRLRDEGTEETTKTVWVTKEWRLHWVWHTFSSGATGNIVVRINSDGAGFLDTIYLDDAQLNDGKYPGILTRTTTTAISSAKDRFKIGNGVSGESPPADFTAGGVATKVVAGSATDASFDDVMSGLMAVATSANRLYVRVGSTWRYVNLT